MLASTIAPMQSAGLVKPGHLLKQQFELGHDQTSRQRHGLDGSDRSGRIRVLSYHNSTSDSRPFA